MFSGYTMCLEILEMSEYNTPRQTSNLVNTSLPIRQPLYGRTLPAFGFGNDCDQDERPEAAEIVRNYGQLIDISKEKAKEVTVSSIPPRLSSTEMKECITAVNGGLLSCSETE